MSIEKVKTKLLVSYFNIAHATVTAHIRRGNRLDLVYVVLNRPELTDKQKENYVLKTSMTDYMKLKVLAAYIDNKSKPQPLEFPVIQERGIV